MGKLLLGVVHLPPLPSAPRHRSMREVLRSALRDAAAYANGGFDGLVIENFGDAPFRKGTAADPVPPDVPAAMAVAAHAIAASTALPLCINVLRNDAMAALGVAAAVGARWIRVNVFTGASVTDQGIVEGDAARVLAYRRLLRADGNGVAHGVAHVATHGVAHGATRGIAHGVAHGRRGRADPDAAIEVLADYLVKHAAPLAPLDVAAGAKDLASRSGAAGIVLSGARTGEAVDAALLDTVRAAVGRFPIWIGSGLTPANAAALWPRCDGAIVGTACKRGGRTDAPVDRDRVRALREATKVASRRVPKQADR